MLQVGDIVTVTAERLSGMTHSIRRYSGRGEVIAQWGDSSTYEIRWEYDGWKDLWDEYYLCYLSSTTSVLHWGGI